MSQYIRTDSPELFSGKKLRKYWESYVEMTCWTIRIEKLGLLRPRKEGVWSLREIEVFHILLRGHVNGESDVMRAYNQLTGEIIYPADVSHILTKFRETGILQPGPSLGLTESGFDLWSARFLRLWGKMWDTAELWKNEKKLRNLMWDGFDAQKITNSDTLSSKLRRLIRKIRP